jgi:hypothetical protein
MHKAVFRQKFKRLNVQNIFYFADLGGTLELLREVTTP